MCLLWFELVHLLQNSLNFVWVYNSIEKWLGPWEMIRLLGTINAIGKGLDSLPQDQFVLTWDCACVFPSPMIPLVFWVSTGLWHSTWSLVIAAARSLICTPSIHELTCLSFIDYTTVYCACRNLTKTGSLDSLLLNCLSRFS